MPCPGVKLPDQPPQGTAGPVLYLASRSPRRRLLLEQAGFAVRVIDSGIDDGLLSMGHVTPEQWVASLAYLKARGGWERLGATERGPGVVLGSDTVVLKEGCVIGQPRDRAHARATIERLQNGSHTVLTAAVLLSTADAAMDALEPEQHLIVDGATVRVGAIGEQRLDAYLDSDGWRGKAGAYNLSERIADGWPISYEGDPATIMGLPMIKLIPVLDSLGLQRGRGRSVGAA